MKLTGKNNLFHRYVDVIIFQIIFIFNNIFFSFLAIYANKLQCLWN